VGHGWVGILEFALMVVDGMIEGDCAGGIGWDWTVVHEK
jgi:hypothetical protein